MMATRGSVAVAALLFVAAVLAVDLAVSAPPNPYVQPPVMAFGSGEAASGSLCSAVPGDGNK